MPGFGQVGFGKFAFGTEDWSRTVLYRYLPALHRRLDEERGYPLLKLVNGESPSFEALLEKIKNFGQLRDPLVVRSQYNDNVVVTLGEKIVKQGTLLQRGVTGTITAFGVFTAPNARFSLKSVGLELHISGSKISFNNQTVIVASVDPDKPTEAAIYPPLSADSGPLAWELREPYTDTSNETVVEVRLGDVSNVGPGWLLFDGTTDFPISSRVQLSSRTEREGADGILSSGSLILSNSQFTLEDIGKRVTVFNSATASNNDRYEIVNVTFTLPGDPTYDPADAAILRYRRAVLQRIGPSDYLTYNTAVADDIGPLEWAILPRPRLTLSGVKREPLGVVSQGGFDAQFISVSPTSATLRIPSGNFSADATGTTAAFSSYEASSGRMTLTGLTGLDVSMIGRPIIVSGAAVAKNNSGASGFTIVSVLNSSSLVYINVSGTTADPANGAINWTIPSSERGQLLTLRGPGNNNGTVRILSSSQNELVVEQRDSTYAPSPPNPPGTLNPPFVLDPASNGPLEWEIRAASELVTGSEVPLDSKTQVSLRPPSLLQYLAEDFGIAIDYRESENQQRSWVRNHSQWINAKGTAKAYQIVGAINGFNVESSPLYRITQEIAEAVPAADIYELPEFEAGRSAPTPEDATLRDGRLYSVGGGLVAFTSASAVFYPSDVGRQIRISGSSKGTSGENNKLYTITGLIPDPSAAGGYAVQFRAEDTAIDLPDPSASVTATTGLRWNVLRLYTTKPPKRPRFDDFNPELMGLLINPSASLTVDGVPLDSSGDVKYTALPGAAGNAVRVQHVNAGALSVSVSGSDVTVNIVAGATTANDVVSAVNSNPLAAALVTASAVTTGIGLVAALPSLTNLAGGYDSFGIDRYCWQPDFVSTIPEGVFTITAVAPVSDNFWSVTVAGSAPNNRLDVVRNVAQPVWLLIDSAGNEFLLESLPVETGTGTYVWTTTVFSAAAPALGPMTLKYECQLLLNCDYCASNKVLLTISPQVGNNITGLEQELLYARLLARIAEATPAHVDVIVRSTVTLAASLALSAEGTVTAT